jgi:hypothetical protein
MNSKSLLTILLPLLTGCSSIKYAGWEDVGIAEVVIGRPCKLAGKLETCKGNRTRCEAWFKKRATKVDANEIIIDDSSRIAFARYYYCKNGLPPYKKVKFIGDGYNTGVSDVMGQAFLRQRGGDVVTCAGRTVVMYPNDTYFLARRDPTKEVEWSDEASRMERSTKCDATGSFEFYDVENGDWIIETSVSWEIPEIVNIGHYYDVYMKNQGGSMKENVSVRPNTKNKFIISDRNRK